jgi:hypothetical protein
MRVMQREGIYPLDTDTEQGVTKNIEVLIVTY